jgi:hypothetical protein
MEGDMSGITGTGLVHLMKVPVGLAHVMRAECFITVIGMQTGDVSNTIIVGTEIATATGAMIARNIANTNGTRS